jgi:deoxycytidylate deaminase
VNTIKVNITEALKKVFDESSDFLIIGLTGRTGSGCSTCAKILAEEKLNLPDAHYSHYVGNEQRKFGIIKKYIDNYWEPFEWLRVTSIITKYILEIDYESFIEFIKKNLGEKNIIENEDFKRFYEEAHLVVKDFNSLPNSVPEDKKQKDIKSYNLYFKYLCNSSLKIKYFLNSISVGLYTKIYQLAGDNIRASGSAVSREFKSDKIFSFANNIDKVIMSAYAVKKNNNESCRIVVDAIRNPYEAIYLKQRFSAFYLISINTDNENRLAHLRNSHKLSEPQIKELDDKEYPDKSNGYERYVSQNIQKCIEIADIHINNPRKDIFANNELRCQLSWYVALMLHAGLVMPTSSESCMQIAYSVKKNSGCISRQVGAVVTDETFAVKAVGWNNTAQGQVPCLLRSSENLLQGMDKEAYSEYEKTDSDLVILP